MNWFHFRYRDRLALLASSSLEPKEANEVRGHVRECASCAAELASLSALFSTLAEDAAVDRPLPISSEALRTRVFARIREAERSPVPDPAFRHSPAVMTLGLAGALVIGSVLFKSVSTPAPELSATPAPLVASAETASNDAAFYERLEKAQTRVNAARYLAEAQDILVQVSAAADCPDSPRDSVDVEREARTSRRLLTRRAALVSGSRGALSAAQGVMEEVEGVLQQVADLPKCTRRQDVDAIAKAVDRRNLLMKIDLVTQELAAP